MAGAVTEAYVVRTIPTEPADVYRFRGSRGVQRWPMKAGAALGATGCWNFALRVGFKPIEVEPRALATLPSSATVFAPLESGVERQATFGAIRESLARFACVVLSGDPNACTAILPSTFGAGAGRFPNPYAGLGYVVGDRAELIAPPTWPHLTVSSVRDAESIGSVASVGGERQTPARALIGVQPDAPAIIRWRNVVFVNGSPFHAFQAWLQGQEDLQPWIQWRSRLFWLDEWAASMRRLCASVDVPFPNTSGVPGLDRTTVVLRHDLDYSRDTTYLDAERAAGVAGVHAILRDDNSRFWIKRVSQASDHETALHYNTGTYSRAGNWIRRRFGFPQRPYVPARGDVAGEGLLRQVKWAQAAGVGVATLHRHLSFLIYPEWIDALDRVFDAVPHVRGGSSLFRAQVLRWGVDRADGGRGTYADFPDAQFPWWFPCRLAHAADGGRMLRGWETASVMEVEPELVQQLLTHDIPGLPQRVFTLNFHPAHAARDTFAPGGSAADFRRLLAMLREARVQVLTLRDVYEHVTRFAEVA
ncbi:MAG TPA: hypothetical protein VFA59_01405 [Vicinamibacterales bacterium]|nr:hypothetical protein [Vicinamibacterales bacterium]